MSFGEAAASAVFQLPQNAVPAWHWLVDSDPCWSAEFANQRAALWRAIKDSSNCHCCDFSIFLLASAVLTSSFHTDVAKELNSAAFFEKLTGSGAIAIMMSLCCLVAFLVMRSSFSAPSLLRSWLPYHSWPHERSLVFYRVLTAVFRSFRTSCWMITFGWNFTSASVCIMLRDLWICINFFLLRDIDYPKWGSKFRRYLPPSHCLPLCDYIWLYILSKIQSEWDLTVVVEGQGQPVAFYGTSIVSEFGNYEKWCVCYPSTGYE